jgi:hypothetical protein
MIAVPRSFLSPSKGTANHYRIRSAGERLANIPSLVHTAIRDDRQVASEEAGIPIVRWRLPQ